MLAKNYMKALSPPEDAPIPTTTSAGSGVGGSGTAAAVVLAALRLAGVGALDDRRWAGRLVGSTCLASSRSLPDK